VTEPVGNGRRRRRAATAGIAATVVLLVGVGLFAILRTDDAADSSLRDRQAAVEARGAHVMPFDQTATTHEFAKTEDGGVETVAVDDPRDDRQIALIRMHLEHEARLFASGDFSDPAAIHGRDMPGLTALERGSDRIEFEYGETPGGASITYRSSEPRLVMALHAWFDAQLTDHGDHAHG
jgi:hypothetical protein